MIALEDWPMEMIRKTKSGPRRGEECPDANEASVKDGARWDIGGGRASKG